MAYSSKLSFLETQKAIELVVATFTEGICKRLNLTRVLPPLFQEMATNDDLYEPLVRPVTFDLGSDQSASVNVCLRKWKKAVLKKFGFAPGTGISANQGGIRKDETPGPVHSWYVDQCEWETVIEAGDRTLPYLESVAKDVFASLKTTEEVVVRAFPVLDRKLPDEMFVISAQELEDAYPELSPCEREDEIARLHRAVFVSQIGGRLNKSGAPHGVRVPDVDDWGLNGDILVYHPLLRRAVEVSSMGIRVTADSLARQLADWGVESALGALEEMAGPPLTYGGGVGRSRLCMFLLEKMHIGEVHFSVWDEGTREECRARNIELL